MDVSSERDKNCIKCFTNKYFQITEEFSSEKPTESDHVAVEDDEPEAEDDSDAKEETNKCVELAGKVTVQPTGGNKNLDYALLHGENFNHDNFSK